MVVFDSFLISNSGLRFLAGFDAVAFTEVGRGLSSFPSLGARVGALRVDLAAVFLGLVVLEDFAVVVFFDSD